MKTAKDFRNYLYELEKDIESEVKRKLKKLGGIKFAEDNEFIILDPDDGRELESQSLKVNHIDRNGDCYCEHVYENRDLIYNIDTLTVHDLLELLEQIEQKEFEQNAIKIV